VSAEVAFFSNRCRDWDYLFADEDARLVVRCPHRQLDEPVDVNEVLNGHELPCATRWWLAGFLAAKRSRPGNQPI
jgi:hypothetical protein